MSQSKMKAKIRSPLLAYGLAIVSVGLATVLTLFLDPAVNWIPFTLFYAAVLFSAWYGGQGPGILTTILSALTANYIFLAPTFGFNLNFVGLVQTGVFLVVGLMITWLTQMRQRAEATLRKNEVKLQQLNTELEQRIAERTVELQATNSQLENEIAERRRAEEALAEERNLLRTLIDNLPDYIYIKDSDSRFITANVAVARGLGVTRPEELVGKTDFDIFPPELAAQYFADEQKVIQSGQPLINREEVTIYPTEEKGWAATTTVPFRDQQGHVAGLVGISRNITERKRMEAELAEIQHWLVESLERDRMHLAQELHDGPVQELYTISFGLNGLKEALSNEADLTQLAAAQTNIERVIQMLRATFSELRPPALAPYGLEKAILSHVEQFQQRHPELKLNLNLIPDGQDLPERIRMALFRIYREALNNIVRHAQAQQVWIEFSLDAAQAILEIKDNGCGFEVPQRWVALARQGHLGLVGIMERAEAIDGQLQIVSAPGTGTLIRVSVPRTDTKGSTDAPT